MHEMGIANSVLDAVRKESRRFPESHVCKVVVRIGELAGVDPEAVDFCFEALVRGTSWEPLELEIEFCPRRYRCCSCGHSYAAQNDVSACPACGGTESQFSGGDELELAYLEVENGAGLTGT
ncbi:MAG TPA: hydrogenase maturation nickel metallochaperone HypA [Candidatus Acidoferrales bacterium]|nr:hydrogenase maturation nickel metallochaperone HypA [Candidatus Acidoferrales bacterium]